jgi:hypothetical protein
VSVPSPGKLTSARLPSKLARTQAWPSRSCSATGKTSGEISCRSRCTSLALKPARCAARMKRSGVIRPSALGKPAINPSADWGRWWIRVIATRQASSGSPTATAGGAFSGSTAAVCSSPSPASSGLSGEALLSLKRHACRGRWGRLYTALCQPRMAGHRTFASYKSSLATALLTATLVAPRTSPSVSRNSMTRHDVAGANGIEASLAMKEA